MMEKLAIERLVDFFQLFCYSIIKKKVSFHNHIIIKSFLLFKKINSTRVKKASCFLKVSS